MFIFPPSGLGCDLEFGFSSFELENPLICVYNKNFRPSGDCQASRPLSDCCGRSKQRRQARGAPGRSSIHTFSAPAPNHRAVFSRFPRSAPYTRFNSQSGGVCTVRCRGRESAAARKSLPHFFPGRWQSLYSSLVLIVASADEIALIVVAKTIDDVQYLGDTAIEVVSSPITCKGHRCPEGLSPRCQD